VNRVLFCLAALLARPAAASQPEQFAPSARSLGLAGGATALDEGGASLVLMPAAMGLGERNRLRATWLSGRIELAEAVGVTAVEDPDATAPARLPTQAVQPHGLSLDLSKTITDWVTGGVFVNLPAPWIYLHGTEDPWSPLSVRWRTGVTQALATAGLAVRIPIRGVPGPKRTRGDALRGGLFFGVSANLQPRASIAIDLDLVGELDEDSGNSSIDVALRHVELAVKARFRPAFSALLDFGAMHEQLDGFRVGLCYRPQTRVELEPIFLDVSVAELRDLSLVFAAVDRIQAGVFLGLVDFFKPHQVRASIAWQRPRFSVALDAEWSQWSRLQASIGRVVEGPDGHSGELLLRLANGTDFTYPVHATRGVAAGQARDTVDLALAAEATPLRLPTFPGRPDFELRVRAGYRVQPSMLRPVDGPSALVDGTTHTIGGGVGVIAPSLPFLRGPLTIDWGVEALSIGGMDLPKTVEGLAGYARVPVVYEEGARWPGGWAIASALTVGTGF
jgi:hypothetical protein